MRSTSIHIKNNRFCWAGSSRQVCMLIQINIEHTAVENIHQYAVVVSKSKTHKTNRCIVRWQPLGEANC
jgi:hypothetical protein